MIKISFIIPVYNSADTVAYSINSIITYPMEDIEVIVIDDGSTDNSLEICLQMAKTDSRIHIFHKENEGPGLTKNAGIDHAVGKYVFLLDSDDRAIMPEIVQLYKKAEQLEADGRKCDIIQGFYYRVLDGNKELIGEGFPNGWISKNGPAEEVSLYHKIKTESAFGYATDKLYRLDFLNKYNIRFCSRIRMMEDQILNLQAWSHNPGYYIENRPLFEYWLRSQSLSQGSNPEAASNSVKVLEIYYNYLVENNMLQDNLDLLVPLAMRLFCWALVKNIPFEGSKIDLIQPRVRLFLNSEVFQFVISDSKHKQELKKLPSFLQRMFFSFSFTCAKWNNGRFIALVMKLGAPVFCSYLSSSVK